MKLQILSPLQNKNHTSWKPNKFILVKLGENQPEHYIIQTVYNLHDKSLKKKTTKDKAISTRTDHLLVPLVGLVSHDSFINTQTIWPTFPKNQFWYQLG